MNTPKPPATKSILYPSTHVFLKWLGALNVELMSYGYNNLLFRYIER